MKTILLAVAAFGCLLSQGFAAQPPNRAKDEKAIRASVKSYVAAFNRGNASKLASHWSDDGEYISPDGSRITGRTSIEAAFKELFATDNPPRLEVAKPQLAHASGDPLADLPPDLPVAGPPHAQPRQRPLQEPHTLRVPHQTPRGRVPRSDQARLVEGERRMRCLHETSIVVQRVRNPPDQGRARPGR